MTNTFQQEENSTKTTQACSDGYFNETVRKIFEENQPDISDIFPQEENSDKSAEAQNRSKAILKALEENKPIYTAFGLTEQEIEASYVTAKTLYDQKKYEMALPLFRALAFYNSHDKRVQVGILDCLEKLSNLGTLSNKEAIIHYLTIPHLDPEDPLPYFRLANCYLAEKETSMALLALEQCILLSAGKVEYKELYENALHISQAIELKNA